MLGKIPNPKKEGLVLGMKKIDNLSKQFIGYSLFGWWGSYFDISLHKISKKKYFFFAKNICIFRSHQFI